MCALFLGKLSECSRRTFSGHYVVIVDHAARTKAGRKAVSHGAQNLRNRPVVEDACLCRHLFKFVGTVFHQRNVHRVISAGHFQHRERAVNLRSRAFPVVGHGNRHFVVLLNAEAGNLVINIPVCQQKLRA